MEDRGRFSCPRPDAGKTENRPQSSFSCGTSASPVSGNSPDSNWYRPARRKWRKKAETEGKAFCCIGGKDDYAGALALSGR